MSIEIMKKNWQKEKKGTRWNGNFLSSLETCYVNIDLLDLLLISFWTCWPYCTSNVFTGGIINCLSEEDRFFNFKSCWVVSSSNCLWKKVTGFFSPLLVEALYSHFTTFGFNFINNLRAAFTCADSKSAKITVKLQVFLSAFGTWACKSCS